VKFPFLTAILGVGLLLTATFAQTTDADPDSSPADLLRIAALNGDANAQFELANQYYRGEGRILNYSIAAHWFRRAARHNHPGALFNPALCYEMGLGVNRSKYQAFHYYRQAAAVGVREARFNLALCYISGVDAENHDGDRTPGNYVAGANIAGFKKVADAMIDQGI